MTGEFLQLRVDLDRAITFGRDAQAFAIAKKGFNLASEHDLYGEVEYFGAQFFILDENFPAAIARLDRAIAINPQDGAAFNDKALCLSGLGRLDAALECFDKGILAEPGYATIHHNKGWLLNKLGRYSEAIECFNAALKLEPERAVTYENLGDVYVNLGQTAQAKEAYRQALRFLPADCVLIAEQIRELLRNIA